MSEANFIVKLTRDQARAADENFFPYIEMLLETSINNTLHNLEIMPDEINQYFTLMATRSLFLGIVLQFDKKLDSVSNTFTFKFTEEEAILLYQLLHTLPINKNAVWLLNLRQLIIESFYDDLAGIIPGTVAALAK